MTPGRKMGIDCLEDTKVFVLPASCLPTSHARARPRARSILAVALGVVQPAFRGFPSRSPCAARGCCEADASHRLQLRRSARAWGSRSPRPRSLRAWWLLRRRHRWERRRCGARRGARSAVGGACPGCRGTGAPHGCRARDAWGHERPESRGPRARLAAGRPAGQRFRAVVFCRRAREAGWPRDNGLGPTPAGRQEALDLQAAQCQGKRKHFWVLIWAHREPGAHMTSKPP